MARISHEQLDIFVASASDVSPKAHRDLMARCWFSLSKNKRTVPIEHRSQNSWIKVSGSEEHGIATIFDNDILIFVIAQLMAAVNDGRKTRREFQFTGYEYFKFIGRKKIGGKAYTDIWKSLERLKNTTIQTDLRIGDSKRNHTFNWLSEIKQIVEGDKHRGYEVVIPEWLYSSVVDKKMVLTIDNDYFSMKGGLERWLYMFGRKSTGHQQSSWTESTKIIYEKSGSLGSFSEFKRKIKNIIEKDNLVGYRIGIVETHSKHRTDRALAFHNRDLIGAPVRDNQITNGAKKYRRKL
jgi:plasmid replication initiation protein